MQIKFIDLETGSVYDGATPFVHWFDEGQSTNLQYIKKICVLSDIQILTFSIPTNDVFNFVNNSLLSRTGGTIDFSKSGSLLTKITSNGYAYKDLFIHMIYVHASSAASGEYSEVLNITDGTDTFTTNVGADFYAADERLVTDLVNLGIEIPNRIQSALYEVNVHEQGADNIVLNRKWKELLIEYANIVMNKGTYNSLLNSLKWFEWGDLLTMYEYWSRNEAGTELLSENDITDQLNPVVRQKMLSQHKTTYVSIAAALDKVKYQDGEIVYNHYYNNSYEKDYDAKYGIKRAETNKELSVEGSYIDRLLQLGGDDNTIEHSQVLANIDNGGYINSEAGATGATFINYNGGKYMLFDEPNPELEKQSFIWSSQDMYLKMALLGSFYSTYFMPIHLDLLHCTLENVVYTNAIKIYSGGEFFRCDDANPVRAINVSIDDTNTLTLGNVKCYVYPDTPLSVQYNGQIDYSEFIDSYSIVGVDTSLKSYNFNDDQSKTLFANLYSGIGSIVPVTISIPARNTYEFVQRIECLNIDDCMLLDSTCIYLATLDAKDKSTYHITIPIKLLVKSAGTYNVIFSLILNTGEVLSKPLTMTITDNGRQFFTLNNIVKASNDDLFDSFGNYKYDVLQINDYVFSHNKLALNGDIYEYMQYLPVTYESKMNMVGLNHVIRCPQSATFKYQDAEYSYDEIKDNAPHYIWYEFDGTTDNSEYTEPMIVGIRKQFSIIDDGVLNIINKSTTIASLNTIITTSVTQSYSQLNINVDSDEEVLVYVDDTEFIYASGCTIDIDNLSDTPLLQVYIKINGCTYELVNEEITIQHFSENADEGVENKKVEVIYDGNYICQDMFIPAFHKLEEVNDNTMEVSNTSALCIQPSLSFLTQSKDATIVSWVFTNNTTDETILFRPQHNNGDSFVIDTNLALNQPIISEVNGLYTKDTPLTPGYYSVTLNYMVESQEQSMTFDNAFRVVSKS